MQQTLICWLALILVGILPGISSGQDPHFSQYYTAPATLNPAMSGVFNGRWRVNMNYRDQWSSFLAPVPFRTYSISGDYRLDAGQTDYFTVSVAALHDEAGVSRYSQNNAHLGLSYLRQLAGGPRRTDHVLAAGVQAGFSQHTVEWQRLWFSRQFDPTNEQPDPTLPSGEASLNRQGAAFADLNAGLLWYMLSESNQYAFAGIGLYHLNRPSLNLIEGSAEALYTRWSVQAGGQFPLSDELSLLPGALFMHQGPAWQALPGLNVRYSNNDFREIALRTGIWGRFGNSPGDNIQADALIFVAMFEFSQWIFGLSYDVTVSPLVAANYSRGAFEISLSYIHPAQRRARILCPKL